MPPPPGCWPRGCCKGPDGNDAIERRSENGVELFHSFRWAARERTSLDEGCFSLVSATTELHASRASPHSPAHEVGEAMRSEQGRRHPARPLWGST